jgi:hypothetical protein
MKKLFIFVTKKIKLMGKFSSCVKIKKERRRCLMETFVLYLYRSIKKNFIKDDSYLSFGEHLPLIAIIQNGIEPKTRYQKVNRYNLQPFEINQINYDKVLINSKDLSITILDIEFNELVDEEEMTTLIHSLQSKQLTKACETLKELRKEMEIESLSFLFRGRHIKVSKYGVIQMDAEIQELKSLTMNSPIAYIAGLLPWNSNLESVDEI